MRKIWIVALVCCLRGQQPQTTSPVVLEATTRLVQLSVIVHDRKGQPVTGLKKEDFQIRADGRIQPISFFSMESAGTLPSGGEKLPPNTFSNRLEQRPGTPTSVTILLLDALNTRFTDQAYARQEVIKYLKSIQPGDHIGIYTLGNSLRVIHDYTTDSAELLRKLDSYKGPGLPSDTAPGAHDPFGGDSLLLDQWLRGGGSSPGERSFYMANRIEGTLRAIEFIANHLARLPGRKNLIWVSGGFPLTIGFENLAAFSNPQVEQRTFSDEVNRTVRAVNDANMAIYPVDARGLMADPRFDASRRNVNLRAPRAPVGVRNQESMQELASRTGGKVYINTNDLKNAIRDAVADTQVSYTLGFYPSNEKYDGKFHEIKVQAVERSGLSLRYRKGYFDLAEQPQDEAARRVGLRDAVWSPIDATAMGLTVEITPVRPNSLAVNVQIDRSSLHLSPRGDRWEGRLDILFVQKDDRGNQYNGQTETVDLNLNQAHYEQVAREGLLYKKVLDRERRASQLRVVVRDAASGSIGSVTAPFSQVR